MALGLRVLVILFVLSGIGLAAIILPMNPQTATAYDCFVTSQECLESRDPVDLMVKIGIIPAIPGYG